MIIGFYLSGGSLFTWLGLSLPWWDAQVPMSGKHYMVSEVMHALDFRIVKM